MKVPTFISPVSVNRSIFRHLSRLLLAAGMFGWIAGANAQQWVLPYPVPSTADDIVHFDNGAPGSVTAPAPGLSLVIAYNNAPEAGSGGGWSLTSTGAASVGAVVVLGTAETMTEVNPNELNFKMVTSGISNLVGINLNSSWDASATITGSDGWTPPTQSFAYNFDVLLNSAILSGNPGLFDNITLTIREGATPVYQQTGLAQILGVVSIISEEYENVMVPFNYNPANGPLSIEWSANTLAQLSLLNLLGNGESLIYSVRNPEIYVDAVPEPGTWVLLLGAMGTVFLLRRRRAAAI